MITPEVRAKLREPLPPESLSPHPTKPYQTTIKAIYVVERLNDVFGVGGWTTMTDWVTTVDKMVVVRSVLTVPEHSVRVEQFGGNDNPDMGDAFKGATTDALTKMASYLEIGIDVFKGKAITKPAPQKPREPQSGKPQTDKTPNSTQHWCKTHQVAFRKTKNGNYSHIIKEAGKPDAWCNEGEETKESVKGISACDVCGVFGDLHQSGGKMVCEECDQVGE